MKDFSIIVTLGPSVFNQNVLKQINELAPCIYRINGAHNEPEEAREVINKMRNILPNPKIMLDLPGNKIRVKINNGPITLSKGKEFILFKSQFNFPDICKQLCVGDQISAADSTLSLEVMRIENDHIVLLSHSEGYLGSNKGFHIKKKLEELPFLFQKDIDLINAACEMDIECISLSYVRNVDDIKEAKKHISKHQKNITIFSKIETSKAVENLDSILDEVEFINIDRGDLSSETSLLKLPQFEEMIIAKALEKNKKVFIATQILKNMEKNPVPLISEMRCVYDALKRGVSGMQLSEETSIGLYPVDCVRYIVEMLKLYR